MGGEDRGGHLDLDTKLRSEFLNVPDALRLSGSGSPDILKKSQILGRVGIGHPDLLKFLR